MMAYYRKEVDEETLPVKRAIIGITGDQQKDASRVQALEDEAIIKIVELAIPLETVYEYNMAVQFNTRKPSLSVRQQPAI